MTYTEKEPYHVEQHGETCLVVDGEGRQICGQVRVADQQLPAIRQLAAGHGLQVARNDLIQPLIPCGAIVGLVNDR